MRPLWIEDAIHPDLCFAVQVMASAHFGASVRNFLMSETRIYANRVPREPAWD
jgi:hypothetical protein